MGCVSLQISENPIIILIEIEINKRRINQMFNIGEKLKKYRTRKAMSQKEFSKFLGISQNYLSEIESGIHIPSLKTISIIAEKMNTTVSKLLGEKTA
jgi:DNA-binding XRE family transcriptional regulator